MTSRVRLLNPGPVTLTERVRRSMLQPDLCHREREFAEIQLAVRASLERVYETSGDYAAVMLTGSGTAAVEAMVGSLVPRDGRALVVANGVYGDRMAAMLKAQGKRFEVVSADWTRDLDLDGAERALAAGGFTHALVVHHETTTGRLNSVAALGALCKRYGVPMLLDAVSSFGGEAIDLDGWNVEGLAATANKCLHGVPGISFALVKRSAFARESGATSVYLDLWRHWKEQQGGWSPFTQSVHCLYALREALAELSDEGGWRARHERYRARMGAVRAELKALGVSFFLDDGEEKSSVILNAFEVPPGVDYERLHDGLKARGFVIYAGQGPYLGRMFRVAVMGDLTHADIEELRAGLRAELGGRAPPGARAARG